MAFFSGNEVMRHFTSILYVCRIIKFLGVFLPFIIKIFKIKTRPQIYVSDKLFIIFPFLEGSIIQLYGISIS
jgi:hypothetical protein